MTAPTATPAGADDLRALDVQIAQRLFAADLEQDVWTNGNETACKIDYAHRGTTTQLFGYSTNLFFAFEVIEEMRSRGYDGRVLFIGPDSHDAPFGAYHVLFYESDNREATERWAKSKADLPAAICRAALAALKSTPTPPPQETRG